MTSIIVLKGGLAAGAAMLMLTGAPAMAAGRCGASYPVDSPVSLAKVASACNVSLAALKEANPGVDPDYVTPGNHLAVPDEIEDGAYVPSPGADVSLDEDYYGETPIYQYAEYNEPAPAAKNNDEANAASGYSPYFIRASASASPDYEDPNLSYQKRSAARIRHAGVTAPAMSRDAFRNGYNISYDAPATLYGEPVSPLMECAVLRRQPDGKIKQVREFKPAPEGRDIPAHCAAIETTSFGQRQDGEIFVRSPDPQPVAPLRILDGYVTDANAECVTVVTADGARLRVAVDLAPMDLLGKHALIWAEDTRTGRCGGLVMASAVYAEAVR